MARLLEPLLAALVPNLQDYAHYTVDAGGSAPNTLIAFSGSLPVLIYQDDPDEQEARIDLASQRFKVEFDDGNNRNLSLLKFSTSDAVWYINVYTQAEDRALSLSERVLLRSWKRPPASL